MQCQHRLCSACPTERGGDQALEARSQVEPRAKSPTPLGPRAFTVTVPQPPSLDALESNNRDTVSKQNDGIAPSLLTSKPDSPILSEQHETHGNTPSSDGTISEDLENLYLSLGADETEVAQIPGTSHPGDDLTHLTTLLRRLNIKPGTPHYNIILETCDGVREHASQSKDSDETQSPPATSTSTTSRGSENGTRSSASSNKRSRQHCEDSDSDQEGLKRSKASQPIPGFEEGPAQACLFYKVNPHIYYECATFKGRNISVLGKHLKVSHSGDFHCCWCCMRFKTESQRSAHEPRCRPTRGPCVCTILPLRRTQGVDPAQRWEETWNALFPSLRIPTDPWWSENILREQITLSNLKKIWGADRDNEACFHLNDIANVLTAWETTPPDHLPDLQDFKDEMLRHLSNNIQSIEDVECSKNISEEDSNTTQVDREPTPNVDPGIPPDNDRFAQSGSFGIADVPASRYVSLQNIDINTIHDFDSSRGFEFHESQEFGTYSFPTDLTPSLHYSQPDASRMDMLNPESTSEETNAQSLAMDNFTGTSWVDLGVEPGFFDQVWVDSEESICPTERIE
ncbi:hypothetical protein RRF57_011075 [Xylaria bambusicola]|uniref:Uncharacterized protein n=1 Tax=Xylaria bambusicola TaxID=326684 RepID=A0AAN7ZDN7_9PEZI